MGNPTLDALSFIIGALFNIYALIVAVRFVMQAVNADGYSPIAQFVIRATDPLLLPLRKFIPSVKGYDIAALLLCFLVLLIKALLFKLLGQSDILGGFRFQLGAMAIPQLVTFSLLSVLNLFFNIFIYSMIILAILSWVSPDPRNPMYALLADLTRPVLGRVRQFVPPMGGFDLSTLVAIIGLYALKILVLGNLAKLLF